MKKKIQISDYIHVEIYPNGNTYICCVVKHEQYSTLLGRDDINKIIETLQETRKRK
jgi:hypothetical protein